MGNLDKSEEKVEVVNEQKSLSSHKKCIHCKEDILSDAKICKHCGKAQPSKTVGVIILSFLIFIIIISLFGSTDNQTYNRKSDSKIFAKEVVRKILKSPSTAEFSNVNAYELSNKKDVWAINGYVDSQNSFGAMMRNVWEVQLDYRDGKGGTVESVMFDGEKIL